MKSLLMPGLVLAGVLGTVPLLGAQDKAVDPPPPAAPGNPGPGPVEYSPSCGWFRKLVHPCVVNEPRTCIRYDVEERDYCPTKCAHTPIPSKFCDGHHCGKHGGHDEEPPCAKCGHPCTRKVLIKEFITEDVPTRKCEVERVPCPKSCPAPTGPTATTLSGEAIALPPAK
jgi:hypothetical protein